MSHVISFHWMYSKDLSVQSLCSYLVCTKKWNPFMQVWRWLHEQLFLYKLSHLWTFKMSHRLFCDRFFANTEFTQPKYQASMPPIFLRTEFPSSPKSEYFEEHCSCFCSYSCSPRHFWGTGELFLFPKELLRNLFANMFPKVPEIQIIRCG